MNALEACYYRTREDEILFEAATKGLPQRSAEEPFHCEAHNVRAFRFALHQASVLEFHVPPDIDLTHSTVLPMHNVRVFEIGFNLGYSAAIMLTLGVARLHSIDIRSTSRMVEAAHNLSLRYPEKFTWQEKCTVTTCSPPLFTPTLAFIDGSHEHTDVLADIAYCRSLGITRYLFDDWPPHWGPGVQSAVYESGLLPLHIIGSMAYCVVPDAEEGYFKPVID